jgi:hypothetical protein
MELNDRSEKDLYARVADIERCIGDFAQVFAALKAELDPLPQPDCPPYCMHKLSDDDEGKFSKYQDPLKIEERVRDIGRCIGDHAYVFKKLREALQRMPGPDCPPYCAHDPTEKISE